MANKVVIADKEIEKGKEWVSIQCALLSDLLDKYEKCIKIVLQKSIKSGQTQKALEKFLSYVEPLKLACRVTEKIYAQYMDSFMGEIEVADGNLYKSKSSGAVRNYDDDQINKIKKILKKQVNLYSRCMQHMAYKIEIQLSKVSDCWDYAIQQYDTQMNNYNHALYNLVAQIIQDVTEIDAKYGNKILTDINGEGSPMGQTIQAQIKAVRQMTQLLQGDPTAVSASVIKSSLKDCFEELEDSVTKLLEAQNVTVSVEDIYAFVQLDGNDTFYHAYQALLKEDYEDMGWDVEATNLLANGGNVLQELLSKGLTIPEKYRTDASKLYDYIILRDYMIQMLCDMEGQSTAMTSSGYTQSVIDEMLSEYQGQKEAKVLDLFASNFAKLSAVKEPNEKLKTIMEQTQGAQDLANFYNEVLKNLEYAGNAADIIAPLLYDYSNQIKMLEELASTTSKDSMVTDVVNSLISDYQNKMKLEGKNLIEMMTGYASKNTIGDLQKKLLGKNAGVYLFSWKSSMVITGYAKTSKAAREFKALYHLNPDLIKQYKANYQEVLQAGDQATTEQIDRLKLSFEELKSTYIKEFEDLAVYYGGDEDSNLNSLSRARYYDALALKLRSMTMTKDMVLQNKFQSFDEFVN